jgi:hypothetical protein
MSGIRTHIATIHPVTVSIDETIEQLAFASMLFRRLEEATGTEALVEEE